MREGVGRDVVHGAGEARSLYSRQEPEHSIVCFRKIRDRTAKANGAQFTLLNRRNGSKHRTSAAYSTLFRV